MDLFFLRMGERKMLNAVFLSPLLHCHETLFRLILHFVASSWCICTGMQELR